MNNRRIALVTGANQGIGFQWQRNWWQTQSFSRLF